MSSNHCNAETTSAKCSLTPASVETAFDQRSQISDAEDTKSGSEDLTAPVDELLAFVQKIYNKKQKITAKNMQAINAKAHEIKNRMIKFLLMKTNPTTESITFGTSNQACLQPTFSQVVKDGNTKSINKWPLLTQRVPKSAIILKPDADKCFERTDASIMEGKVSELLTSDEVRATILSSATTKRGDIVINFDKNDNVKEIAKKVEMNLGFKTHSQGLFLPKITISHVPQYISLGESLSETIVKSNSWLQRLVEEGEKFEVLFSYKVRDLGSIVCKISPRIREEIIRQGSSIKIENRFCRVKDRFHIVQCSKCLAFGHKGSACSEYDVSCDHCSGAHLFKDCPHKDDMEKLTCSNCKESKKNKFSMHPDDLKHSARSFNCPLYMKQMKRCIDFTNWGNGPIPNLFEYE